jgi:hypothetical protein
MAFKAQAQVVVDLKWVGGKYPSSPGCQPEAASHLREHVYVQA